MLRYVEGRVGVGFDLGLGLPGPGHHHAVAGGGGPAAAVATSSSSSAAAPLLWPTGLLDSSSNNAETWRMAAGGMWPEFTAAAAQVGSSVPSENKPLSTGEIMDAPALTKNVNKMNHQYSERLAVPEKSAYLEKQTWMDS